MPAVTLPAHLVADAVPRVLHAVPSSLSLPPAARLAMRQAAQLVQQVTANQRAAAAAAGAGGGPPSPEATVVAGGLGGERWAGRASPSPAGALSPLPSPYGLDLGVVQRRTPAAEASPLPPLSGWPLPEQMAPPTAEQLGGQMAPPAAQAHAGAGAAPIPLLLDGGLSSMANASVRWPPAGVARCSGGGCAQPERPARETALTCCCCWCAGLDLAPLLCAAIDTGVCGGGRFGPASRRSPRSPHAPAPATAAGGVCRRLGGVCHGRQRRRRQHGGRRQSHAGVPPPELAARGRHGGALAAAARQPLPGAAAHRLGSEAARGLRRCRHRRGAVTAAPV